MNVYVVLAVGALCVGAGALLAKGVAPSSAHSDTPTAFAEPCRQSLSDLVELAGREDGRKRRESPYLQLALLKFKIPAICACSHNELQAETDDDMWGVTGKLIGIRYAIELARRGKDREAQRQTAAKLEAEVMGLVTEHNLSKAEIRMITRRTDRALGTCFRTEMKKLF